MQLLTRFDGFSMKLGSSIAFHHRERGWVDVHLGMGVGERRETMGWTYIFIASFVTTPARRGCRVGDGGWSVLSHK
jgi:hypothetical protein